MRKGWLQHFLNYISKLFNDAAFAAHYEKPYSNIDLFLSYNALYIVFYIVVISISIIVSYNGGIIYSTSSFYLLNIYGFNVLFNFSIYSAVVKSPNYYLN